MEFLKGVVRTRMCASSEAAKNLVALSTVIPGPIFSHLGFRRFYEETVFQHYILWFWDGGKIENLRKSGNLGGRFNFYKASASLDPSSRGRKKRY